MHIYAYDIQQIPFASNLHLSSQFCVALNSKIAYNWENGPCEYPEITLQQTRAAICENPFYGLSPAEIPTINPTMEPTAEPTIEPTADPTIEPTADPTIKPTSLPSMAPTIEPTTDPTIEPTSPINSTNARTYR